LALLILDFIVLILGITIFLCAGVSDGYYQNPDFKLPGLINPDNFQMNHSLTFSSGFSSNGNGYYSNTYTNHMIFNLRKNLDEKIHAIALLGLENNISQLGLSSPVEVLLLLNYIDEHREQLTREIYNKGKKNRARELDKIAEFEPKKYWPNLSLLNYLKGGFAQFYLNRVGEKVGSSVAIRDPGIYSSEGRISLCLSDEGTKGVIAANSNFFEFAEIKKGNMEDPVGIGNIELNKTYSILLTTQEGLYRYDLGDVIRVVDFYNKLPMVEFVDRRERGLSLVGEHITESELVNSVKKAAEAQQVRLTAFTVVPNTKQDTPRYEFFVETKKPLNQKRALSL